MNKIIENFRVKSNLSLIIIYAGVLSYVLMLCLFFYEEIFLGQSSIATNNLRESFFNLNPAYILWLSSIMIQPVIWVIFLFPATTIIIKLKSELDSSKNIWMSYVMLLIAFGIFVYFTSLTFNKYFIRPQSLLVNHITKLQIFTMVGQIIGIYYLFGGLLVSKVCMKNIDTNNYELSSYRNLKHSLEVVLNFAGTIFSLGVISAILLHKAINNVEKYPVEFVISLGVMNSLIILINYLPAYFSLHYYGRQLLENRMKLDEGESDASFEVLKKQNEVLKNFDISIGLTQAFKTAFVILSPIISSLIPKLFEF